MKRLFPKIKYHEWSKTEVNNFRSLLIPENEPILLVPAIYHRYTQTIFISIIHKENHGLGLAFLLLHELAHHFACFFNVLKLNQVIDFGRQQTLTPWMEN
jgi:hypothetical protein